MYSAAIEKRYIDCNFECRYFYRITPVNESIMESRVRFLKLLEKAGLELSYIYYSEVHDMWEDYTTKTFDSIHELESNDNYMRLWPGVADDDWKAAGKYYDVKIHILFWHNNAQISVDKRENHRILDLLCQIEPLYCQEYPNEIQS